MQNIGFDYITMNRHRRKSGKSLLVTTVNSRSYSSVTKHNGGWNWGGVRICTDQHKGGRSNVTRGGDVKYPGKKRYVERPPII